MADRDRDYYLKLFTGTDHDPIDDADLDKLIEFISMLGDRTEDDGELEDDYETMDPEDFLRKALGEDNGNDEEGINSVGENEDEGDDSKEPDSPTVSDEDKKEKEPGKKEEGCVSDKGMKKPRKRMAPSEEDLTRMNIASALADLRF